jgi:hypothetical protein
MAGLSCATCLGKTLWLTSTSGIGDSTRDKIDSFSRICSYLSDNSALRRLMLTVLSA